MREPVEASVRAAIAGWGRSLFERGLTSGSSGNISVRLGDRIIATPTNSCLGFLDAERLSVVSLAGDHLGGDAPTKELPLHLAFYRARADRGAVVHLHSSHATALSCLRDTAPENAIPPITPYVVMRAGAVPVVPYRRPGSPEAGKVVARVAGRSGAVLIANHGPVAADKDLDSAVFAIEEIEEAARLILLTRGLDVRLLDEAAVADLNATFRDG